jgi:hypothetical protein
LGIAPSTQIPLLFNAFTRLEQGRNIEGSGLGLSIAKAAADLMGGFPGVESGWGAGSVFSAEAPQKIPDPFPMGNWEPGPEGEWAGSFTAPEGRALVVDPEIAERMQTTEGTIRTALNVIYIKLDIHSKKELADFDPEAE